MNLHEDFIHSIKNAALGISTAFFSTQATEGFHVSRVFLEDFEGQI